MSLKRKFEEFLRIKFDSLDEISNAMDSVYAEFLRKLCNTRLGEFLDSYKQIQLSKSGSASLSGQNLRDTLLSQHVQFENSNSLETNNEVTWYMYTHNVTVTSLYDYTSFSPTEELYCLKERPYNLYHCGGV